MSLDCHMTVSHDCSSVDITNTLYSGLKLPRTLLIISGQSHTPVTEWNSNGNYVCSYSLKVPMPDTVDMLFKGRGMIAFE